MESEDFDYIHYRYDNYVDYLKKSQESETAAFENWIKRETLALAKKRELFESTNRKPSKIDCVFCNKEVARQNISFHYESCLGSQFFNYMRGSIFKGRNSCNLCGKIFLKKHRNRHSCDINKKNSYNTCEYCGFNFIYHKKCRVQDLTQEYYKKLKSSYNYLDDNPNFKENSETVRKGELIDENNNQKIKIYEEIKEEKEENEMNCEIKPNFYENDENFDENLIISPKLPQNFELDKFGNNFDQKITENSSNTPNVDEKIIKDSDYIIQNDSKLNLSLINNQDQIENKILIHLNNSNEYQKEQTILEDVELDERQDKPLSKITKLELLKIAKLEIKILMNFKNWFDKMRTQAIRKNKIHSYKKKLQNIYKNITKIPEEIDIENENITDKDSLIEAKFDETSNMNFRNKINKNDSFRENKKIRHSKEKYENNLVFDLKEIAEPSEKGYAFLKYKRSSSNT